MTQEDTETRCEPSPGRETDPQRLLEAARLSSPEPLSLAQLRRLFEPPKEAHILQEWLNLLQQQWQPRVLELVQVAGGWRFQTRPQYQEALQRLNPEKPPRYSRAVMETLAIIAYRQPVTRGDIEEIRGVAVATPVLRALELRGWIEVVGQRDSPGRPALYGTTTTLLDDLNVRSLRDLPPLVPFSHDSEHTETT